MTDLPPDWSELTQLRAENARLRADLLAMGERLARCSEALSKVAEAKHPGLIKRQPRTRTRRAVTAGKDRHLWQGADMQDESKDLAVALNLLDAWVKWSQKQPNLTDGLCERTEAFVAEVEERMES